MKLMARLRGEARVEILCPEPELLLNRCGAAGIPLREIRRLDALTLRAALPERALPALREQTERCRGELRLMSLRGGSRSRARLKARRALMLALALTLALLLVSSLFVWEIEVRGCESLSRGQILRALADCGVEPGCFWPALDSDLVRSRMLTELPELGWMTVNVSGSRALVLVRERREKPEIYREEQAADLVAAAPGVIRETTVLQGHCLVQPGDAVLAGETLVSGSLESQTGPARTVRARGEIRADTWRELTAVCPLEMLRRREIGPSSSRFSLQFGKNRLKISDFPGKALDECDTIVHEYTLGVEGLFTLPVKLIREERRSLSPTGTEAAREREMEEALLRRLEERIDGEILESSFSVGRTEGLLVVTLRAHCVENIAETKEYYP